MIKLLLTSVIALKFLLPLFFFHYPFQASWINFILDTIDGDILLRIGLENETYQVLDKVTDYVTYMAMLLVGWRWKVRKTILFLFGLRTIGQALFFATHNELTLFFFPNFLEPLFMAYSFLVWKYKDAAHQKYQRYLFLIWFIIVPYKLWNEWNTHIANIELSEVFFGFE